MVHPVHKSHNLTDVSPLLLNKTECLTRIFLRFFHYCTCKNKSNIPNFCLAIPNNPALSHQKKDKSVCCFSRTRCLCPDCIKDRTIFHRKFRPESHLFPSLFPYQAISYRLQNPCFYSIIFCLSDNWE